MRTRKGNEKSAIPTRTWVPNPPQYWFEWPSQRPLFFWASYLRIEERELEAGGLN